MTAADDCTTGVEASLASSGQDGQPASKGRDDNRLKPLLRVHLEFLPQIVPGNAAEAPGGASAQTWVAEPCPWRAVSVDLQDHS
jgi:hypothetical protein